MQTGFVLNVACSVQTFARVAPTTFQLVEACILTCKHYKWRRISILYSPLNAPLYLEFEQKLVAYNSGITIAVGTVVLPSSFDDGSYMPLLQPIKDKLLRIICLILEDARQLRRMALTMYDMQMYGKSWVVFVPASFLAEVFNPWTKAGNYEERDGDVAAAMDGWMLVSPAEPLTPNFDLFMKELQDQPWPPPQLAGPIDGIQPPVWDQLGANRLYLAYFHDSLVALAMAIGAVEDVYGDVRNGTAVMSNIYKRLSFEGLSGVVAFDDRGNNRLDWGVYNMYGKEMRPVAR